jgi:hypothetical protein
MAPLESASTRRASLPGLVPDDAHGPSGLSRQPATTRGRPPIRRLGGPGGCTSVVEAERSRIAQRGFADPRADRDVAVRLSEGPVPAAQRCGEIKRAASSGMPGELSRRHRNAGAEAMQPATRLIFIVLSRQASRKCSGAPLSLMRSSHSPDALTGKVADAAIRIRSPDQSASTGLRKQP